MRRASTGGIDRRPDEHHRSDAVWLSDRKLGDDLTTKGICNERGTNQVERRDPLAEHAREVADPAAAAVPIALPLTREIGHADGGEADEPPSKRKHVRARHAVAVHEHNRRTVTSDDGVHAAPADVGPHSSH
jgi:hypothetical protein